MIRDPDFADYIFTSVNEGFVVADCENRWIWE